MSDGTLEDLSGFDKVIGEIIVSFGMQMIIGAYGHGENQTTVEVVNKVKQAFADAGYYYESEEVKQKVIDNALYGTMTGQQWYDRFQKEMINLHEAKGKKPFDSFSPPEVLEIARRAAGINEDKEDN